LSTEEDSLISLGEGHEEEEELKISRSILIAGGLVVLLLAGLYAHDFCLVPPQSKLKPGIA